MVATWLLVLLGGLLLFELAEHVVLPLVLAWRMRRRRSVSGAEGMVGKVVRVKGWRGGEGQVMVDGELWTAVCGAGLEAGDRAVVRRVEGLALHVERIAEDEDPKPGPQRSAPAISGSGGDQRQ